MKKLIKTAIEIEGIPILVKIYEEPRKNIRASMNKNGAILRMPNGLNQERKNHFYNWFNNWLKDQLQNEKSKDLLIGKTYNHGDSIKVYNRTYQLDIQYLNRKTHGAKLKENTIYLSLNKNDISAHLQKSIRQLISRVVAKDCLFEFEKRVDYWNDTYFQEKINNIRFKNNQTNWGSCSSKRNLNFSTRLLFATQKAIDYVIVHELAHLKELNHSPKFWKIVSDIMPDYKQHEKWLNKNGHLCQF
ncbi:MAG: M48 family metallopeptidase [Saprospiraceae bacterium]